jgi:hypothetical protein
MGARTVKRCTAKYGLIYIYIYTLKYGGPPADGGHPGGRRTGGRADIPAGGGQGGAILRMGIHAYAMGEGRMRREPQRGGRGDVSTFRIPLFGGGFDLETPLYLYRDPLY